MTTHSRLNYPVYGSKTQLLEPLNFARPSVPLSVYRQLVKELQATQGQVKSLELHNQELIRENQQLREHQEQLRPSASRLQQAIDTQNLKNSIILKKDFSQTKFNLLLDQSSYEDKIDSSSQAQFYRIDNTPQSTHSNSPELVLHSSQVSQLPSEGTEHSKFRTPINGWVLALGIFLIVALSCTGALLVVNLKLNLNNR